MRIDHLLAMISARTKAALAAAKERGVQLPPKLKIAWKAAVAALKANADHHAADVIPIVRAIQRTGARTLDALNAPGISTPRGRLW